MIFIPVPIDNLPEYLSSGFVGLPASVEPDQDLQSSVFPHAIALRELTSDADMIFLAVEDISGGLVVTETDTAMLVMGPISIGSTSWICFPTNDRLEDFRATYGVMPDLNLEMFEFRLGGGISKIDLNQALLGLKVKKRAKLKGDPSRIASILLALCDGLNLIPTQPTKFELSFRTIDLLIKEILHKLLDLAHYPEPENALSENLLVCYLEAISKQTMVGSVSSSSVISGMKAQVLEEIEGVSSGSEEAKIWARVSLVIDKVVQVSRGLESPPNFADTPSLVLQRAICLAALVDNYDSFVVVRRNWSVGDTVEALAKVLVGFRDKLNRLPAEIVFGDAAIYKSLLSVASKASAQGKLKFKILKAEPDVTFGFEQRIEVNDQVLSSRRISAPNDLVHVVTVLRSCGYNPLPLSNGGVSVTHYDSARLNTMEVKLDLKKGPTQQHRRNVEIYATVPRPTSKSIYATKKGRYQAMELSNIFMVSVLEDENNAAIKIQRTQLIDTMDKDELNYHVELVALASLAINEVLGVA